MICCKNRSFFSWRRKIRNTLWDTCSILISFSWCETNLSTFLTLPIFFMCWKTVVWGVWSSYGSFQTVVLTLCSNKAFRWSCWITDIGLPLNFFSRLSSPEWNLRTYLWTVLMFTKPLPKANWIFCKLSVVEWLTLYASKKITQHCLVVILLIRSGGRNFVYEYHWGKNRVKIKCKVYL